MQDCVKTPIPQLANSRLTNEELYNYFAYGIDSLELDLKKCTETKRELRAWVTGMTATQGRRE